MMNLVELIEIIVSYIGGLLFVIMAIYELAKCIKLKDYNGWLIIGCILITVGFLVSFVEPFPLCGLVIQVIGFVLICKSGKM